MLRRHGAREYAQTWACSTVLGVAEATLAHAVLVREANVLCSALNVDVEFQMAIQRPFPCAFVSSAHDSVAGLTQHERESTLIPRPVVRLVDRKSLHIQYWDLEKLIRQVNVLNCVRSQINNPSVAQHTDTYAQFFKDISSSFSHLGSVRVPLFPLVARTQRSWRMPIQGVNCQTLGHCRISVAFVRSSDQETVFRIAFDELTGITSDEASELHLQLHLDSITGMCDAHAGIYATRPVLLIAQPLYNVRLQRTFCITHTADTYSHWRSGAAAIHVLGRPTAAFLTRMLRWEKERESRYPVPGADLVSALGKAPPSSQSRVHERKRRVHTFHGVHSQVHMLRWEGSGIPSVSKPISTNFPLFPIAGEGMQCLTVSLDSDSGPLLPWTGIRCLQIGEVQLRDGTGSVLESEPYYCTLQRCSTSKPLHAEALWRPNQSLLKKPTPPRHYVRALLQVEVEIKDSQSMVLCSPLFFRVQGSAYCGSVDEHDIPWNAVQLLTEDAHHTFFKALLKPNPIQTPYDLWRVDTRMVQVPGNTIVDWIPRGLSLVVDYLKTCRFEEHAVEVCRTRERVNNVKIHRGNKNPALSALRLWQDEIDSFAMVSCLLMQLRSHWKLSRKKSASVGFSSESTLLELSQCFVEGWLEVQRDAHTDYWVRAWFELRPYVWRLKQPISSSSASFSEYSGDHVYLFARCACVSCTRRFVSKLYFGIVH